MNAIILYSEELLPMVSFEENVGIFFLFLSRQALHRYSLRDPV